MSEVPRFLPDPGTHFFLFGPRGTGKSTWLARTLPGAVFVDLLDAEVERRLSARPERLRELVAAAPSGASVVVDEVQRVPELLPVVHQLVEERPPVRFVLTGSSARKLRRGGTDLLAGRAVVRSMHPFLAAELGVGFDLGRALREGLVPLVWDSRHPADTLRSYAALYVQEEVRAEGLVRNLGDFARFLEAVALSHGGQLNVAEIARECAVSRSTVDGFLSILEDLLLSFRVPIFRRRAARLLAARPKHYLFDVGVFRSLRTTGPLDRAEEIEGAALEGLVAQHLRAWCDYTSAGDRLYFWRTKAGLEVDLVTYGPAGLHGVEVKRAREVRPRDLRGLKAFLEDYPEARALLVYLGKDRLRIGGVDCIPSVEFLASLVPGKPLP